MTINELLVELNTRDIQLRRKGQELHVRGDQGTLEPFLVTELSVHKKALLDLLDTEDEGWWSPPVKIAPEMLSLVELSEEEIERVVGRVAGGAGNIQDIYPLAPLQEGIFFHYLMGGEGDPYVLGVQIRFRGRKEMDAYIGAMKRVVERHDILRTGVVWEGLREPVQVVWRKAELRVEEVKVEGGGGGSVAERMYERYNPRRYRMDVGEAPMLRVYIAEEGEGGGWLMMLLLHHLIGDHTMLEVMQEEMEAYLAGREEGLGEAVRYREVVGRARLGKREGEDEGFFREMLGDVEEVTAPFGIVEVQGDGGGIEEERGMLGEEVGKRLRERARKYGVSAASIFHVAWARVLGKVSGREDVVFGTVLLGRMQGGVGTERVMGMLINTLPVRIQVGQEGVEESVRGVHRMLGELMRHEHASLALAQRCSGVAAPTPLFSSLFNYRHSAGSRKQSSGWAQQVSQGMKWLRIEERTNYAVLMSVDDVAERFELMVQAVASVNPKRVCEYMGRAVESLVKALEEEPGKAVNTLEILGEKERKKILYEWNATGTEYQAEESVHGLFEEQAERTPARVAVEFGEATLSYGELNRRANLLRRYLKKEGVKEGDRVGICLERGLEMVVAMLGVLKAEGAYVLLDPGYPGERLRYMIEDSAPVTVVTRDEMRLVEVLGLKRMNLEEKIFQEWGEENFTSKRKNHSLACIMYNSGTAGKPQGVIVTHRNVVWRARNMNCVKFKSEQIIGQIPNVDSDAGTIEILGGLLNGGRIAIIPEPHEEEGNGAELARYVTELGVSRLYLTTALFQKYVRMQPGMFKGVEEILFGDEACDEDCVRQALRERERGSIVQLYGATESTNLATSGVVESVEYGKKIPIGKPAGNMRAYIVDGEFELMPVGVVGEIYISGPGVTVGYMNQPEMTAERFVPDLYIEDAKESGVRMYRTGDFGKWREDGSIELAGRKDLQVRVNGFRIELTEIEMHLERYDGVKQAAVALEEDGGEKCLTAYYTLEGIETGRETGTERVEVTAGQLREFLRTALPEYMVPTVYVLLEEMPLRSNGRLDRRRLPKMRQGEFMAGRYEAPQGEIETALAAIWAQVLQLERVGRKESFFELGGNSLRAVQLISRIRMTLNVELDVRDVFRSTTLEEMALILGSLMGLNEILDDEATPSSSEDRYL